ncbi:flavin-nucleotide-binding protein [Ideonella sp. YS5]|uniref:flavin-nucleotide-binding protein n=1 Tax=Ideonella sp. YS5 TaxID=3453714 RepID=UPI003EE9516E
MTDRQPLPGWAHAEPAFHAGERALQARAGVAERMAEIGHRVVRAEMPDQHRELFEKLPFMLVGALDAAGRPWATMAAGRPGFVRTPDARSLVLGHRPIGETTLDLRLEPGRPIGLLGIEPSTRRRNRANGVVASPVAAGELAVEVVQSFGNCPKYIQARDFTWTEAEPAGAPRSFGPLLPAEGVTVVHQADTFFIATASSGDAAPSANGGVDVSHRGGLPGFVRVSQADGRSLLTIPDYAGNFFFNTLGNVAAYPRAGLLVVDWRRGDLWCLTGKAEVLWNDPAIAEFDGAQRLLRFQLDEGWHLPRQLPLRTGEPAFAPQFRQL